ncbi:MAG: hypothetical protein E6K13_09340, partial [Methanobacteriota archaeon]
MTDTAPDPPTDVKRIPSGIPGFDSLIQGGLPSGASVVVQGPAGVEKDAFLVQFLAESLRGGGAALVVLTSLPRLRFQETLRIAGVDVNRAIEDGRLRFVEWLARSDSAGPQVEVDGTTFRTSGGLPNAAVAISRAIDALPLDGDRRAAFDILSPALLVADPTVVVGFARAMRTTLERFGFTSLFALEKTHDASTLSSLQGALDGVVDIVRTREGSKLVRKVTVLSLRGTTIDSGSVHLTIRPDGLIGSMSKNVKTPPAPRPSDRPKGENAIARRLLIANERLAIDPEDTDALFVKAASFARTGRRQDLLAAIATLEAIAKIDERYPGLWRLKAKIHGGLGEREKAEECQSRAVEADNFRELSTKPSAQPAVSKDALHEELSGEQETGRPVERKPVDRVVEPNVAASTDPSRHRGMKNGLAGHSLRGGMGRTTGLTNGIGQTNGLGGRTNGLTNGLATVRRGMTNGLTNGNGFTNGLGAGRFRREAAVTKWKLYVIPLLSVVLLMLPLLGPSGTLTGRYPIRIDGDPADWNPAAIAAEVRSVGPNPDVDIVRFGIADNVDYLAFFLEVNGAALRGGDLPPTVDVFRVFLDTDRDAATGYRVDGLGADRMLQVSGWHGAVNTSTLFEWDTNRDAFDWRGWTKGTPAQAAVSGSRVEAQVDWLAILPSKQPVYATAHARSHDGTDDTADYVLSSDGAS